MNAETEKNQETSRREVENWLANKPSPYFAYVNEKDSTLTTWMGDKLGDVIFGAEYKTPAFGWPSTRVAIRVRGINGVEYYGTYFKSSGDYARIKACK